jgi:DnaD/phage-associated family protein
MDKFQGFPASEIAFISVPDLFFSGLLPLMDNLPELKVTLHMIWLRQRQGRQAVTRAELEADETLARGLASLGDDPAALLEEGLARAVERGTLLHNLVSSASGTHAVYLLNSEGGRQALAAIQAGQLGIQGERVVDRPAVEARPNIFELYENNIGLLSPILTDELREAETSYPAEWIEDAFRIAAANNVRKWRYVQAVLERWATKGRGDGFDRRDIEKERRWFTDEEFEKFFLH